MNSFPLYIHVPFCLSKCAYCDFFSVVSKSYVPEKYVEALIKDAREKVQLYQIESWSSIYIGGGTPSLLSEAQIKLLFTAILELCPLNKNAEITFEANPDDITPELLSSLKSLGVNRLSIGIQSFNDKVLSTIGRRANEDQNRAALKCIQKNWLQKNISSESLHSPSFRFSADLIAGLPYQSDTDFLRGLRELINYNPDHISLYSLMLEEGTPLTKAVVCKKVPYDVDKADEQWLLGRDELIKAGYLQYEVSNFCKPHCESQHNMAYWQLENYIGIGAGGSGTVENKKTGEAYRWTGVRDIEKYCACRKADKETISKSQRRIEFLMMGFRTARGVNALEYKKRFGSSLDDDIGTVFSRWQKRNLAQKHFLNITKGIEIDNKKQKNATEFWALTSDGLSWLNQFLQEII
ncbi:MAG: hypothetical protein BKP49_09020 [Treponema sp. CETP13]|nr:MAG: hypothetical protein BKP49_09020 [Treponema sp. CETP13]